MMVDWLAQVPVLAVAVIVLFAPGLLIGLALKVRGLSLWAMAPVLGAAAVGALAIVFGAVGIPWSALSIAAGCLVSAGAARVIGLSLGSRRTMPRDRRDHWLLGAGLVVGVLLGVVRFGLYLGAPDGISQTNDAIFHLNALRWIIETGNASSFHLSGVLGARGVYPAAWHGLTSTVVLVSGAELPVAVNAMCFAIAFGAWPVGIAWFTRVITRSGGAAAIAAALSTSMLSYPQLMLQWGVLYPYGLSVALLPAATAITVAAGRWIGGDGPVTGRMRNIILGGLLVLAAVGALALAQPATMLAWGVLVMSWATWGTVQARSHRLAAVGALLVAWAAFLLLWIALTRVTSGAHWEPFRGGLPALVDVLVNSHMWLPPAIGVSILCVAGLIVSARSARLRWLTTAWLVFAALYVAAAAVGAPLVRTWVVGAWYADPYRFAALAPVVVIPLAAIGLHTIVSWASAATFRRRDPERTGVAWAVAGIAVVGVTVLVVAPVITMPNVFEGRWDEQSRYINNERSFLSPDERAVLERLPDTVPADATVIANPSTGAAFGYALSGRHVYPRTWQPPGGSWDTIAHGLRDAAADPAVCAALAEFGSPGYVLDFGEGEASPGRYIMPGMTGFAGQPGFELVDSEGDASLWRITACAA